MLESLKRYFFSKIYTSLIYMAALLAAEAVPALAEALMTVTEHCRL